MLAERNNEIKKAYSILQVMSKDKESRALYLAREMALSWKLELFPGFL